MTATQSRTGAQVLVDQLRIHGVDLAFSVPGESFLAVLDALYDAREDIRLITCRHEANAANMAEAHGKLTGRPGICLVTRGPGASQASAGLHTAFQDSTPLILFIGQVQREALGREAFQEVDYRHFFSEMSKWVCEIHDAARIPELLSQAFHVATTGRPGPVVIALPQDMLTDVCEVADARPYQIPEPAPTPEVVNRIGDLLRNAKKPLVVVGGSRWSEAARACTEAFAAQWNLPVIASFRCQDHFDNHHPNYAGELGISCNPKLAARVKESDLLLVLGARLGETTTNGYSLVDIPVPQQTLIHAHAGAEELGRVYQGDLLIHSAMGPLTRVLAGLEPPETVAWSQWTETARDDYLAYLEPFPVAGALNFGEVLTHLRGHRHQRRRPPHRMGAPLLALPGFSQPTRPNQWVDGLRLSCRSGRQAGASATRGGVPFRRWLLPDGRSGAGNGGAIRREPDHRAGQQQHVRHHPGASGTRLSGAGAWHGH